jgi:hypothetical protein
MTKATVKLQIPFESLLEAIANLPPEEKRILWQSLNEQMNKSEADSLEQDPYDWGADGIMQLFGQQKS